MRVLIPWSEAESHVPQDRKAKIREQNHIANKFNKDFQMAHIKKILKKKSSNWIPSYETQFMSWRQKYPHNSPLLSAELSSTLCLPPYLIFLAIVLTFKSQDIMVLEFFYVC